MNEPLEFFYRDSSNNNNLSEIRVTIDPVRTETTLKNDLISW